MEADRTHAWKAWAPKGPAAKAAAIAAGMVERSERVRE